MRMFLMTAAAMALAATTAQAAVISVSGAVFDPDITDNNLDAGGTENALPVVFDEAQNIEIEPLTVDFIVGDNIAVGDTIDFEPPSFDVGDTRVLSAGTYDSHFVHFDPIGAPSPEAETQGAEIIFDGIIVAIIVSNVGPSLLNASDSVLGTAASYSTVAGRQIDTTDVFTLKAPRVLRLDHLQAGVGIDNIRVITADIPLPAAGWLMLGAIGGFALLRRAA
ncbi:MAG: VPLPA-CTERM sorting domain-containing protein [Pseudomonadota bacterium]